METEGERRDEGRGRDPRSFHLPFLFEPPPALAAPAPTDTPLRQSPPRWAAPPGGGWGRAMQGHAPLPPLLIAEGRHGLTQSHCHGTTRGSPDKAPFKETSFNKCVVSACVHRSGNRTNANWVNVCGLEDVCTCLYGCLHAHLQILSN